MRIKGCLFPHAPFAAKWVRSHVKCDVTCHCFMLLAVYYRWLTPIPFTFQPFKLYCTFSQFIKLELPMSSAPQVRGVWGVSSNASDFCTTLLLVKRLQGLEGSRFCIFGRETVGFEFEKIVDLIDWTIFLQTTVFSPLCNDGNRQTLLKFSFLNNNYLHIFFSNIHTFHQNTLSSVQVSLFFIFSFFFLRSSLMDARKDQSISYSRLTQEEVEAFCIQWGIDSKFNLVAPGLDKSINQCPAGSIALYCRHFEFSNLRPR
ncbi:hypothetical protein Hanom_Chr05g00407091 [Helianthus anomalus]